MTQGQTTSQQLSPATLTHQPGDIAPEQHGAFCIWPNLSLHGKGCIADTGKGFSRVEACSQSGFSEADCKLVNRRYLSSWFLQWK